MAIKIKLDLTKLVATTLSNTNAIGFTVTNKENFASTYEEIGSLTIAKNLKSINTGVNILQNNDMLTLSATNNYVIFDAEFNEVTRLNEFNFLFMNGFIEIVDTTNKLFCYRQNSENDELNKALNIIKIIDIQYKTTIALKSLSIDLQDYHFDFNYIYIPVLHRYYYVSSVEMMSKDICRLHLQEDVLMSWKALIKSQSAFVTRYENSTEKYIVDVRRPLEDKLTVEYLTPTPTGTGSLVNTTLSTNLASNVFKIMVDTITTIYGATQADYAPPSGLNLPSFTSLRADNEHVCFLSMDQIGLLTSALVAQSDLRSYINSAVILPFDPYGPYYGADDDNGWFASVLSAKDDVLCTDGRFHDAVDPSPNVPIVCSETFLSASLYFIISDFTLSAPNGNYLDYDPYSVYEIYVPFVGWIKLNANQVLDKRLIVYYTLDPKTGMGTAYIYSVTDQKLLWSSNCQFGIKLDLVTTNEQEITRQKQANQLNMILGLMASAVSIGAGVATENPVAIAGGVLSAGKTIASAVNSNMMLFERAQVSFGTAEGVFHSPMEVCIRRSYHEEIDQDNSVYEHLQGYPYNKYDDLNGLTGYVEVGDIHFDLMGYDIFQDEVTEIVALLKNGVIM